MKRIALITAVALPLAACSKEQPKKVEIRPVRVITVQHAVRSYRQFLVTA
jgi:hypothetical protein